LGRNEINPHNFPAQGLQSSGSMVHALFSALAISLLLVGDFAAMAANNGGHGLAEPAADIPAAAKALATISAAPYLEVTHLGAIHPAVVAVFQMLASLLALVGFSKRAGH